jgi:hypothetical protein
MNALLTCGRILWACACYGTLELLRRVAMWRRT